MSVKRKPSDKHITSEPSLGERVSKALQSEAKWTDKDEFLDVVYWLRQILGLFIGILWGVLAVKGILGLAVFFGLNALVVYMYASSYQKVDEEEYGGIAEILKEGLMTSFATFLVSWIILYSALHFD